MKEFVATLSIRGTDFSYKFKSHEHEALPNATRIAENLCGGKLPPDTIIDVTHPGRLGQAEDNLFLL